MDWKNNKMVGIIASIVVVVTFVLLVKNIIGIVFSSRPKGGAPLVGALGEPVVKP